MKTFVFVLMSALSVTALAYKDGTYKCKSSDPTVPPSEYKIETQSLGSGALPYMEITRHYRMDEGDLSSPVRTAKIRGLATVIESGSVQALQLASMRFEFEGDTLLNCRQ